MAALVVAIAAFALGFGVFAKDAFATNPGPTLTATAPASAIVGSNFDYTVNMGTPAAGFPAKGYGAGVLYNSLDVTANTYTDLAATSCAGWVSFVSSGPTLNSNLGATLPPPLLWTGAAILDTGTAVSAACDLFKINFQALSGIPTGYADIHMISMAEAAAVGQAGFIDTFTDDTAANGGGEQANSYVCGGPAACGPNDPGTGSPDCTVLGCTQAWDVFVAIQQPAPVLSITKSASAASIVAGGQPETYTINVSQTGTPATGVVVTDNIPAAFPIANATLPVGCTNVGQVVTCTVASLPATIVIPFSSSDPSAGGTSPCNTATVTDTNVPGNGPGNGVTSNSACVNIIPPAVAWSKSPTQGNLWLANTNAGPSLNSPTDQLNTYTFNEILTNVGDPHGLGGFSFDIHWDVTQYQQPAVDMSPAMAIFAAAGRFLNCTVTIPTNGDIHEACASTGTFGSGPSWVGPKVMAHVTLTPQSLIVESIRPNKENGDISTVKDDQVTVTNTCGQPLNDGTIQPVPGQPECQGNLLLGVGPGGVLNGNPNGGETTQTVRRLEGDITQDCVVDVSDMQLEASKFGQSVGGLLYNVFYDVNSPLQHGDGEIDINDIQFVFGRNGSSCAVPIPAQPAQSAP